MYRQIITPQNTQLLLQLPAEFVGKQVEVIAFEVVSSADEFSDGKRKYEDAIAFYRQHAVDFSKIKKWKREDLYE